MILFFDIDDTLTDSKEAHSKTILHLCQKYSLPIQSDNTAIQNWLSITQEYLTPYFEGDLTLNQQRILRIKSFFSNYEYSLDDLEAEKIYEYYHKRFLESCDVFPDVLGTLNKLHEFSMGIISNGTYSDQIFKLRNNNLSDYFDPVIISEKVGYSKPEKEIFNIAAKQAEVSLSDCIYIGNSYELDYKGSLRAGMKALWINREKTSTEMNNSVVHSLNELIGHKELDNS